MKNKFIALLTAFAIGLTGITIPTIDTKAANASATYNVLAGTTVHVLPQYTTATGTTYTYTSSNSGVATVDSQGNVTGIAAGTATILVKRTITNTVATPTPYIEAKVSKRVSNVTTASNTVITPTSTALSDWNTSTATPTSAEPVDNTTTEHTNYIEGLSDATATPVPTLTPTSGPSNTSTTGTQSSTATSAKTTAVKTTSVSSYAMYTVNVIPLTINATKTSIGVGDTLKLTTNIADSVTWGYKEKDSEADYAGEAEGNLYTFTPEVAGTYTITATYNEAQAEVSNSITIEVAEKSEKQKEVEEKNIKKVEKYIEENGFKFTDSVTNLAAGDSILFTTNLDKLKYANVTWTSSDTEIATVSEAGLVTGKSEGTARIVATAAGKKISKTVTVEASSVFKMTKTTDEIAVSDSFTFKTNRDSDVKWESSNENVLTVNKGKITGKSIGTATITATYNEVTLRKTVNVTGDSTTLHVISDTNTVNVNEKIDIETNRDNCVFSVDNANIAFIDPSTGILTGKSQGTAIVTITCGSEKVLYTVNVVEGTSSLAFVGVKDSYTTGVNSIVQTNKANTSFISSNTAVATIDRTTGELKTITEGVTVLYAFNGTEQVSKQIKVITLGKNELLKTIVVGDTATLVSNEENVTWSSSNQDVVQIDTLTGKMKAVGTGTCMIYMYSDNKITYTEVCVRAAAYTKEQQKAISDANRYIRVLLSEDGESLKIISTSNADTILTYLTECRKYLDICEELEIDVTTLEYYDLYDAGLNQYLLSAKGYTNGTLVSLEEGKQAAIVAIDQAILAATACSTDEELSVAISNIEDLITNAKELYLVTKNDIGMYDVLSELIGSLEDTNSST